MHYITSLVTGTAVVSLLSHALAFDASGSTNLAVYWGQGTNQKRLSEICQQASIDIIPLGFLNVFPDQGAGGYPGTNFGNACGGGGVYTAPDGTETQLLNGCTDIAQDIPVCQSLGKKILLSLGGAVPETYKINDDASAVRFADFVWGAFGPDRDSWTGPRPFGNAVVDGFDFDIEHNGGAGYAAMITRLRELYQTDSSRTYYISGAPQCVTPDAQLSDAIAHSWFDFIWIQFFNTRGCSARDYIDGTGHMTFDDWVSIAKASFNPNAKVFIGLPADVSAVFKSIFYLEPAEVSTLVTHFKNKYPREFGGLMLWEAAASDSNQINGQSFAATCKQILTGQVVQSSNEQMSSSDGSHDSSSEHSYGQSPDVSSEQLSGQSSEQASEQSSEQSYEQSPDASSQESSEPLYDYDWASYYAKRGKFMKVRRNTRNSARR